MAFQSRLNFAKRDHRHHKAIHLNGFIVLMIPLHGVQKHCDGSYLSLSLIAVDMVSAPASKAYVKRIFSTSGDLCARTGFPLFWKKKIQEFSNPILEFSRCFQSQFAAEMHKIRDTDH